MTTIINAFSEQDSQDLLMAKRLLDSPSFMTRMLSTLGTPLDHTIQKLPQPVVEKIYQGTHYALEKAFKAALLTLNQQTVSKPASLMHKLAVATTGAVGGAFGLPALLIELPTSTTIMMRSIADIARHHGEDLSRLEAQVACLEVFALGGTSDSDDGAETGYFLVRAMLGQTLSNMAQQGLTASVMKDMNVIIMNAITLVAKRFGVQVTEKFVAQGMPVIGAVAGAVVNTAFINHFQNMATGHFTVRRLERIYGIDVVKERYLALS